MSNSSEERQPELRTATLADIAARDAPRPDSVTSVIQHQVKPEEVAPYEQWLSRIMPVAARFPGHRGVNVIPPVAGNSTYTITIRFDSLAHAEDWFRSEARRQLVEEATPFLAGDEKVDTVTGLEFWFRPPPGQKPAKRYKQFLLTLSVIYPLTLVVPPLVRWLLDPLPLLHHPYVEHLVASAVVVGLLAYVVMPRYTRLMAKWLYR